MRTIEEVEKELDEAERYYGQLVWDNSSRADDIRDAEFAVDRLCAELAALKGETNDRAG